MKRPIGITIIALVFAWFAISGFGNAWIILTGRDEEAPTIIGVLALLYSITAFLSTAGLWMMKPWVIYAIRSWMGVCVLFLFMFVWLYEDLVLGSYVGIFGLAVFIFTLFLLFDHYVRSLFNKSD